MSELETVAPRTSGPPAGPVSPSISGRAVRRGDRMFRAGTIGAGLTVLVITAGIAAFLIYKAIPAFAKDSNNFFTTTEWLPDAAEPKFGIAALFVHTMITGVLAMILAVPVAIGIALFINFYAPRRVASGMAYVVDLLAAVPSIVYGLVGATLLHEHLGGLVLWLSKYFGWTVFLKYRGTNEPANFSDFAAGIVLAVMILPIVSSLSREVFRRVPREHIEASLALGATRLEMVRTAVIPYGRSGVVSASILGLGRALGETLAVTFILSSLYNLNVRITEDGGITFASNIANKYNEAGPVGVNALIASGLCLFVITMAVNMIAQVIVRRGGRAR